MIRIVVTKVINPTALTMQLQADPLFPEAVAGLDDDGNVWVQNVLESQRPEVEAIVAAHNADMIPTPMTTVQRAARKAQADTLDALLSRSKTARRVIEGNVPDTWSDEDKALAQLIEYLFLRLDVADRVAIPDWRSESNYEEIL